MKTLFFMGMLVGLVFAAGSGSVGSSRADASAPVQAGSKIAFSCSREGLGLDVCVMNADGSGQRNLTRHPAIDMAPSWSPDGQRIAFSSDRTGPFEVYVMNANGGDQQRLTRTKGGGSSGDPAWSPDGQRIAFTSNPEGNSDVYVVNADGSGLQRLTRRWDFDGTPVWSPDGRRIAFTSWHRGSEDVYVMNADGTGMRNLTRNAADNHVGAEGWSPDGRQIVFASDRAGNSDIYVMNADGSGQRNLTRNPAADLDAAWSPDGRRIAFTSDRDGNRDIYVMNADGSGPRNLSRSPAGDGSPAWSPLPRSTSSARGAAAPVHLGAGDATPRVVPDSLVKVDLESDKIIRVVPVGRIPGGIEIVGRYVFATSEGDGTLTRVDTRTGAVVTSGKYDATGGLAAEGAKWVWVASVRRRQVSLVDAALPLVDPAERVPLPRDTKATSLAVGGGSLWIASSTAKGAVVERWRLHPLARQQTYELGYLEFGNDVTFGYGAAWIALGAPANALLRIDARSGRATHVPVGRFPLGLAAGFGSVWVAQKEDGTVRRIDPTTGRTRRVIAVGHQPNSVAVAQQSILVTNECDGTVSRIDPATNRVVGTIRPGYHPRDVAARGGFAWLEVAKDMYFDVGTCP